MKDALEELYSRNPCLEQCRDAVANAFNVLLFAFRSGGKVLVCGNGGSAADAEHIVGELMKGFKFHRRCNEEFLEKPLSHKSHMLLHTDHNAWEMPESKRK